MVISDVVIEDISNAGFWYPEEKLARIRKHPYLDSQIESMAVTLDSFAIVEYRNQSGEWAMRPVRVMGVELKSRTAVGGFRENLKSYKDQLEANKESKRNDPLPEANFDIPADLRQLIIEKEHRDYVEQELRRLKESRKEDEDQFIPKDVQKLFGPAKPIPPPMSTPEVVRIPKGAIIGHLLAPCRRPDPKTGEIGVESFIRPGDRIKLATVSSGESMKPVYDSFVVVDYFKSDMSEYDANCVFMPLEHLQSLRGMNNRATSILIKLKNYDEAKNVVDALKELFKHEQLDINTWEDKQGPLLKAIDIEKRILNILLFMIVGVAGFGILSIFSMIVAEKTRDIGILKALGASSGGIMRIFLTYGLLLGVVGALLGTTLGLSITWNINAVEAFIAKLTGSHVFQPDVYYFKEIPTDVSAYAVTVVNLGAIAIATVFSILPALRAAMLHPVQALRYE
jgi:lipoprotein-releasing system permease protein